MFENWYGKSLKLGMLGGGQLGRMFIQDAINFDVHVHNLDPDPDAPCAHLSSNFEIGDITNYDAVYNFGKNKEILTIEIENVNIEALKKLELEGVKVYPQPHILEIIKDKGLQKQFYLDNNIPTSSFALYEDLEELKKDNLIFPCVQKLRTGGYDGKGVCVLKSTQDFEKGFSTKFLIEDFVPFEKELSVIVARNARGEIKSFPTVECVFNDDANLVDYLFSPANISAEIENDAANIAKNLIEKLALVGILAVEFFLTKTGELLVNEIAPRPHNSGHHTIDCNVTSQFEQHLRAILNMPLGSTEITSCGAMVNLIGDSESYGTVEYQNLGEILEIPGVHVHLYGKAETKPFRKMGHITICRDSTQEALKMAKIVKDKIKIKSKHNINAQ